MSDGTMFAGSHPRSGPWETLKGRMLSPHVAAPLEGHNSGDPRFNGEVNSYNWEMSLKAHEGMTRGGGTMAK